MHSLQKQLIKAGAFETVSVCQGVSGSHNRAEAPLATVDLNTSPRCNLKTETQSSLQKSSGLVVRLIIGFLIPLSFSIRALRSDC